MRHTVRALTAAVGTVMCVAACSGSSGNVAQPGPVATIPHPPASPTHRPSPHVHAPQPASTHPTHAPGPNIPTTNPEMPANHRDFGYVVSLDHVSGVPYVQLDRAILLTGAAANRAAKAHGDETPVPNDYYIVNDNPHVYTFQLSDHVMVLESQALQGKKFDGHSRPGPLADLEAFVEKHPDELKAVAFDLHFDGQGLVDRIEEQYFP